MSVGCTRGTTQRRSNAVSGTTAIRQSTNDHPPQCSDRLLGLRDAEGERRIFMFSVTTGGRTRISVLVLAARARLSPHRCVALGWVVAVGLDCASSRVATNYPRAICLEVTRRGIFASSARLRRRYARTDRPFGMSPLASIFPLSSSFSVCIFLFSLSLFFLDIRATSSPGLRATRD